MTKSQEGGHNEITDEAKREAARTGEDICDILARMMDKARDKEKMAKIKRAQKYLKCRNQRKRRSK